MGPLHVEPDPVGSTLGRAGAQVSDAATQVLGPVSDDPAVASALNALGGRQRDTMARTGGRQTMVADQMPGFSSLDAQTQATLGSLGAGDSASQMALGMQFATGFAQGFSSSMMAAQQMSMGMGGMGGMGMGGMGMGGMGSPYSMMGGSPYSGYPAGTKMVPAAELAALLSGGGGISEGDTGLSTPTWNGSTAPDPISVNSVALQKVAPHSSGQLSAAIDSALTKKGIDDPAARGKWKSALWFISQGESTHNVNAVNMSDSNAVGGTASDGAPAGSSRGFLQMTPGTFAANHAAGTSNNIYDPEAQAAADINYLKTRYHCDDQGNGLDAFVGARSGGYHGY